MDMHVYPTPFAHADILRARMGLPPQHRQLRGNGYHAKPNHRKFDDLEKTAGITDAGLIIGPCMRLQKIAICNAGFQINTTCYHR
ncbi:MAG: hypothetical protein U1F55_05370 [Chitinivorax sp.]